MQLLVKVHLVTGEYRAAEKFLNILDKGLIDKNFVKSFKPFIEDTSLIREDPGLFEKRSSIPTGKELSPFIEKRLQELLVANRANRTAYEYLMICYLLNDRLDKFQGNPADRKQYYGSWLHELSCLREQGSLKNADAFPDRAFRYPDLE